MSTVAINPAFELLGLELADGWIVVERLEPTQYSTGGTFSVGYLVEKRSGEKGFLKALDFSSALQHSDPPRVIQALTESYNYERDLLIRCRERRMSRVATAIADGAVDVPGGGPLSRVSYLIFERAERDVRHHLALSAQFDVAWKLRSLHHVATGLRQLHSQGIAHQDLKPSNVLVFGGKESKVSDLGTATRNGQGAPHDSYIFPGDPTYAPIECLYLHCENEWRPRRLGADCYMFGSLIHFFFGGVGMTAAILSELRPDHFPGTWGDGYIAALPFVREAFDRVIRRFQEGLRDLPAVIADDLVLMVRQLCDPEPSVRGDPKNRRPGFNQFAMERFVGRLNLMAGRLEVELRRRL